MTWIKHNKMLFGKPITKAVKARRGNVCGGGLRASFTVEAAVVMPVIFITIAALINIEIKMHDIVVGNSAVNEAAELIGHLSEERDISEIGDYENGRLAKMFSGGSLSLNAEAYGEGSRVTLYDDGENRVYEDDGYRPEKLMRKLTLLEEVTDND